MNDTKAIENLVRGLVPTATFLIEAQRRPPVLIKDANARAIPDRVSTIASLIDAASVDADVFAVLAHEDCDDVEPAHVALSEKIETAFSARGYEVGAATPAWETETWLMQWPDAFRALVPSWRSIATYRGRHVGLIENAKEDLIRQLRVPGGRVRDYRESDAPALTKWVAEHGLARGPEARSDSYRAFVVKVDGLLAT